MLMILCGLEQVSNSSPFCRMEIVKIQQVFIAFLSFRAAKIQVPTLDLKYKILSSFKGCTFEIIKKALLFIAFSPHGFGKPPT